MKPRVPVLVLLFTVSTLIPLHADYRPVRGSVLVLVKTSTAVEDPEFRSLLLSVCRIEIEARELEVLEPQAAPPEKEKPADTARKAGAEFALTATYATSEREAVFELTWYDVAARTQAATVTRKANLDFTLDVTIAAAAAELLEGQKERIAALPLKPDPNAVTLPAIVDPAKDILVLEPLKPIYISAGVSPLISTFSATQYIQELHFGAKAAFAWRFPILGGAGGIGITSGFQKYYVTNVGHPGWFYGIPIGAQVQYGTRMPGLIDFFVHFDGGALVWYWDQDDGNRENGVVWYIAGGVGLVVNVFRNLGVAVDVTYSYYPLNPAFTFLEPSVLLVLKL